jgi:regulator of sigma D
MRTFKVWHTLDIDNNSFNMMHDIAENILDALDLKDEKYKIDDEGILEFNMDITYIEDVDDLSYVLDDDIVIYGADSDILMTKKTMRELGLD